MFINDDLVALRGMFLSKGFDIRIVGGAVRDSLVQNEISDIDLCTDAYPDEQKNVYEEFGLHYLPTGVDHGTYTVMMNGEGYEITSLRTEINHDGRHAVIAYTRDWMDDLQRRDLTINAMAMTFDGKLIDPFNGKDDLLNQVVRFVGDAKARMREDYLRIFRYFRFLGRFGNGQVHPDIVLAMSLDVVEGLERISAERVWSETKKIVAHNTGPAIYCKMHSSGVCGFSGLPIPMVRDTNNMQEMERVHKHTRNPVTVMCAIMIDQEEVLKVATRLKWSRDERELALAVVRLRTGSADGLYRAAIVDGLNLEYVCEAARYLGLPFIASYLKNNQLPVFPVTGSDMLASGVKPSREMGDRLLALKNKWFNSGCTITRDELMSGI